MKAALQNYHALMQRVLDYIDRHLDVDLDLETVSGLAAFSKSQPVRPLFTLSRI
jgi:AraC family transcriptional regulator